MGTGGGEVRRTALTASTVALALSTVVTVAAPAERAPIHGLPLRGTNGLRLVVAAKPPLVLDVDTGRVSRVRGVRAMDQGVLWVVGVGGRAAVVVSESVWRRADLYGVRGRVASTAKLGTGADVAPAADGESVWVRSFTPGARCALRHVGLDGRTIRARRAFPCGPTISAAGSLGLVVGRTRVTDPRTGRTVVRTPWGVLAAAGNELVLAGPGDGFTLLAAPSARQRRVPWPHTVGGLDSPAVDPRGRFVALAWANPAWAGGPQQALDVWLLDTKTARLRRVPGMPAFVALKRTSMAWTDDGRLVLLGESGRREFVALWRPGERSLHVKTVRLPGREASGSDSFAVLR